MAWGKKKNQGLSYFGTNVILEGRLCFTGVIRLDGRINGDIVSTGLLTVAETAVITGNILVENLVLNGIIYGNIQVFKHAQLTPTSKVYGHISYGELSIDGALHDGNNHKMRPEEIEKAREECLLAMEEMSVSAEKAKPDEAALEQYSSSLNDNAAKQTSVLFGKKPESVVIKKSPGHHGKAGHALRYGGSFGPKAEAYENVGSKALKIATKSGKIEVAPKTSVMAKVFEAAPLKKVGDPAKRDEFLGKNPESSNGNGDASAKNSGAPGGSEDTLKKAEQSEKIWELAKKPVVAAKSESRKPEVEAPETVKKEEPKP